MQGTRTIDIAPSLGQRGIPAPECGTGEADALATKKDPLNIMRILGRPFLARQIAEAQLADARKEKSRRARERACGAERSRGTRWT